MRLAASVETERLTWQAGTPGKPWQNFSFPHPPRFVKPSKIKPAPPKIMEMLLKKEIGTAKVILSKVCFISCPVLRNSHPSSAKDLTLTRLRRVNVKISSYVDR
jgi:hypothetical protein